MQSPWNLRTFTSSYWFFVQHVVPGPMSFSYIVPYILLPTALMIPPERCSQNQLICIFLVPMYAFTLHAWMVMGGWDVLSLDMLLWGTFLIALNDARTKFMRVLYVPTLKPEQCVAHEADFTVAVHGKSPILEYGNERRSNGAPNLTPGVESTTNTLSTPRTHDFVDQSYPSDFFTRLSWVLTLAVSDRLVRWKIGSVQHDSHQETMRSTRLQRTLYLLPSVLLTVMFLYGTSLIATYDPFYRNAATIPLTSAYHNIAGPIPSSVILLQQHIPPFILRPLTTVFYAFSLLSIGFTLGPILVILLNYFTGLPPDDWSPHTIPPYMGPVTAVLDNGLRGFWGTWWHQHMRFMVQTPGKIVVKVLGLKRGSTAYYTLPLLSAFLFSGITHMGLVPPEPAFAIGGTSAAELRWRMGAFFWVQPVGILCEMPVERVFDRVFGTVQDRRGITRSIGKAAMRFIRLLWVLSWLSLTMPLVSVCFAELGWWEIPLIPTKIF